MFFQLSAVLTKPGEIWHSPTSTERVPTPGTRMSVKAFPLLLGMSTWRWTSRPGPRTKGFARSASLTCPFTMFFDFTLFFGR